ncbi:MAG: hypothetical protein ACRDK9_00225 [Solirubrobacterales bacterium]
MRAVYREIWQRAADAVGATLGDLGSGFLELRSGSRRVRVWLHWIELEDIVAHRLSLDKARVHELLAADGVSVPEHVEFDYRDLRSAETFMAESELPCVVKPASGTGGGGGVTSGVRTAAELVRARLRASRADTRLLIERQAQGVAHRVLVLDGELLDAVRRRPPSVQGDGRSSIAELIAAENRRRLEGGGWQGFRLLTVDLEAVLTLERQGFDLGSVPAAGASVTIKAVESQNAPRENETVREAISPELVAEAGTAARAVGLRLAGIDLVAPDLSRPLRDCGGVIVEVNGTPGFQYHYLVAEPDDATEVAVPILRKLLDERSP